MRYLYIFTSILMILLFSCSKENIITDSSAKLSFSTDTVSFDTVFSTVGSTTKELKIYNPYNERILIKSIKLSGNTGYFSLNINGISSNSAENVEIDAKDSLYIFIEVTIDPTNKNSPIEILDSIEFNTNGNLQNIKLQAFGQDMILINGEYIQTQTWNSEKPYLIINSMLIDSLNTLTIEAGSRLYFSRNSTLYVKGTLSVSGEYENEVVFQGSRLEHVYTDVPGQWKGIVFLDGSQNNLLNYAIVKNAVIGLNIGFIENLITPEIEIHNSRIEHHSYAGIYALDSKIFATNSIISNCGNYLVALVNGGKYEFLHCTFANYWNLTVRQEPSVVITNFLDATQYNGKYYTNNLIKANFKNSILAGTNETEIGFGKIENFDFNYSFENCLLKTTQGKISEDLSDINHFKSVIYPKNSEKIFVNSFKYNFNLDTIETSAKDAGNLNLVNDYSALLQLDIDRINRTDDFKPDLGAYEQKKTQIQKK